MLSSLAATQVAFLQMALPQAAACGVWARGAWFVRAERAPLAHWADNAGLGSIAWALLARHLQAPPLVVVMIGICSAIALRRGFRLCVGQSLGWQPPALRLVLKLQQLARRDGLTGRLNRRAVHTVLDQQAQQRRRAADTFSELMNDGDRFKRFKQVNDRYGHEVGDRALVT